MSKKYWIFLIPLVLFGAISLLAQPASADSLSQAAYQTPTAQPDGRVVYLVQEGDSCLRIQLLTGVSVDDLRSLNKLDASCTIAPGKELLLAVVTPAPSPTPNPLISPTPLLPTPTPYAGNGKICVMLYNDVNGNAVREDSETVIVGGAISITNSQGTISKTGTTSEDPLMLCQEVPEGKYNISMAIPSGYNPTNMMDLKDVAVQAGDQAILEFGAQVSSVVDSASAEVPEQTSNNLMLALMGGLFLLLGAGLGVYILLSRRG